MVYMNELFADGGVIIKNPSPVGGTWAWVQVVNGMAVKADSGVIPASKTWPTVSNNYTEMAALLYGLYSLRSDWCGRVCSDSQITLGRLFWGWKWTNLPGWMHDMYQVQRARLTSWDLFQAVLLDGHPTADQLKAGVGKRGSPVSEHNVWCDRACGEAAKTYLRLQEKLKVPA
jgi:ribonuclease HI